MFYTLMMRYLRNKVVIILKITDDEPYFTQKQDSALLCALLLSDRLLPVHVIALQRDIIKLHDVVAFARLSTGGCTA